MNGLADQMHEMAGETRGDFDGLADRQTETLDVLRKVGDSSVNIRKEIEDLKRRVSDHENEDKPTLSVASRPSTQGGLSHASPSATLQPALLLAHSSTVPPRYATRLLIS